MGRDEMARALRAHAALEVWMSDDDTEEIECACGFFFAVDGSRHAEHLAEVLVSGALEARPVTAIPSFRRGGTWLRKEMGDD